jgi:hypothetical protein
MAKSGSVFDVQPQHGETRQRMAHQALRRGGGQLRRGTVRLIISDEDVDSVTTHRAEAVELRLHEVVPVVRPEQQADFRAGEGGTAELFNLAVP